MQIKIISHRANLYGPDSSRENYLKSIKECISLGFDVEIDLRTKGKNLYLGHDDLQEKVSLDFLIENNKKLWIHCKDFETLNFMIDKKLHYFWHQKDDYTLTSKKIIWTYPNKLVDKKSIIVCLTKKQHMKYVNSNCLGICTDWCYLQ